MAATGSLALEALNQHQAAVSQGVRYRNQCSRCNATGGFKQHERRRRGVRVIVDLFVQVLQIVVVRWKCLHCAYVFTDLPGNIIPYRRYASSSLMPLARAYLEQDSLSYEQAVRPDRQTIGYAGKAGSNQIDERRLRASTLWRFLTFLSAQTAGLATGLNLWAEADPHSTLHRFTGDVAPHKFRSPQRQEGLRIARRLLALIDRWDRTFAEPFFPRFATRAHPP